VATDRGAITGALPAVSAATMDTVATASIARAATKASARLTASE